MNRNWAYVAHIGLIAIQFLVPAFANFSATQNAAIATFVATVQATLGIQAYTLNTNGSPAPPSPNKP